jgi:hypothetical protein
MFKAMSRKDYHEIIERDSFFYSGGFKNQARAIPCMTTNYYVLVWEVLSRSKAIEVMRKTFMRSMNGVVTVFHGTTETFEYISKTLSGKTERQRPTPIVLWEDHDFDSRAIQLLMDKYGDQYGEMPTWVKYPHLSDSVFETVVNRLESFVWNPLSNIRMSMIPRLSMRDMYRAAGYDCAWLDRFGNNNASGKVMDLNPWQVSPGQHGAMHALAARSMKIQNHSAFGSHYSMGKEQTSRAMREYWKSPFSQFDQLLKVIGSISQPTRRAMDWPAAHFDIEADMLGVIGESAILPTGFGHLNSMLEGGFKRGEMVMVAGRGPDPELTRLISEERLRVATAFVAHDSLQRNKEKKK